MMTVEALKNFGANTEEGLSRCMNNEAFYLRMVGMGLGDPNFDRLKTAVEAGDAKEAFEAAHALKGVMGNLSLTPLYVPLSELTEQLQLPDPGQEKDQYSLQCEKENGQVLRCDYTRLRDDRGGVIGNLYVFTDASAEDAADLYRMSLLGCGGKYENNYYRDYDRHNNNIKYVVKSVGSDLLTFQSLRPPHTSQSCSS